MLYNIYTLNDWCIKWFVIASFCDITPHVDTWNVEKNKQKSKHEIILKNKSMIIGNFFSPAKSYLPPPVMI